MSRQAASESPRTRTDWGLGQRAVVVSGLVGAAVIHGSVAGEHLGEWAPAGLFFLALELVELVLALLAALWWGPRVAGAVVVTGVATLAVWTVSRTIGMPLGPPDFRVPEPVGLADVVCGALELASVLAALPSLRARRGADVRVARGRERLLAAAAAAAAFALTAWVLATAVTAGGAEHQHGHAASSALQ